MSPLSKRVAALEASLSPLPAGYEVVTYCQGDIGFDDALAKIMDEDRGKPEGITDQDEVFRASVIKGLKGHGDNLAIVRTVVDPKPEVAP